MRARAAETSAEPRSAAGGRIGLDERAAPSPRAERLKAFLSRWLFSPLQGMTLGDWLRVLAANRGRVHPAYWARATLTTATAASNSVRARREARRMGTLVEAARVDAPVFILGHYRSGTTHLQNLMALDDRFGFANNYEANFPHTFLTYEESAFRLGARLAPHKRPHDDVALGLATPAEDELALCADTALSPHMGWHFPARADHYERYLTFRDADPGERERWKASLGHLLRKLTVKHGGRRLVLKSPCHTARVALIREAVPDARFVHIHRDPYRVYQSTRHMELKVRPLFQYQRPDLSDLDDRILRRYRTMYEAYFEDRERVPPGHLVEVSYDALVREPVATLRRVYDGLGLSDFEEVRPTVERYLAGLSGYRNNRYADLDPALRARIAREWAFTFEAWGYRL